MEHEDEDLRQGIEHLGVERHSIALEHLTVAADNADDPSERSLADALAAQVSLILGRPYESIAWAERLRRSALTPDEADLLEASAWVQIGDGERALALLEHVTDPDTDHTTYPPSLQHQLRCQALGFAGDVDAAVSEAFTALLSDWELPEIWRALAVLAAEHEIDVTEAVARIPDEGLMQVLGWLLESPPAGTDHIVEALWATRPGDRRILALATALGNRLSLERALDWSIRLRAAGLANECSILGIAAAEDRPAPLRVRAAAVAAGAFDDDRALPLMELATAALADDEVDDAFRELLSLSTDTCFDAFIVAAATTVKRCFILVRLLLELGVPGPAVALTRHAAQMAGAGHGGVGAVAAGVLDASARATLDRELCARGAGDLAATVRAGVS